ncbi:MAG: hypothetical protein V2J55_18980 [Candidatus Competibacteraceae bacterium]|jgi:hypothetical protein|nr:hypothetical protein [Candidatus Competibacteraceae bacterium]
MKKKALFILLAVFIATPAFAANWRYVVYLGETLIYDGPTPPLDVNLTYPPFGEPLPERKPGEEARGVLLDEFQYTEQLLQPHVVIIPPGQTAGGRASNQAPTSSSLGEPVQLGF